MTSDDKQAFGNPIGEEQRSGEWSFRHFEHGSVYTHPKFGSRKVPDPIRNYWMKGLRRSLGFPTSDLMETEVAGRPMRLMDFQGGKIYWDFQLNVLFNVKRGDAKNFIRVLALSHFGYWERIFEPGVVGVHAALLHTNQVLFWSYRDTLGDHEHGILREEDGTPILDDDGHEIFLVEQNGEWSLLNLTTGTQIVNKQVLERNQFCGGQCLLGDGNLLVVGGERNTPLNDRTVRLYHPTTHAWSDLSDLPKGDGRYYPTVVTFEGTNALVVGGAELTDDDSVHGPNGSVELIDEKTGVQEPRHDYDDELKNLLVSDPDKYKGTYPFVFVLPGARLFVHLSDKTRILNLNSSLGPVLDFDTALKLNPKDPSSRTYPYAGTAVLLPLHPTDKKPYRPRIMIIGGSNGGGTAKDTCEILDLGVLNPQWEYAAKLNKPRTMGDAVLLPDGKVLLVNGSASGQTGGANQPVMEAELYDPATNEWTTLASMGIERLYHSTALLLPDARVLTAGTDRQWNNVAQKFDYAHTELEVFSPPYLFRGPRPTLRFVPESISYNTVFEIGTDDAEGIKSAVLIRNGSCTHSFNSDQRFVELKITKRTAKKSWELWGPEGSLKAPKFFVSGALELQCPPDRFVTPEGYYMLFLVSHAGVPSVAEFVRLEH